MSDHDDMTPPMGVISDPAMQHILERTWKRIEIERRAREDAVEHLRKKVHDVNNDMAKLHTNAVERAATSDGMFDKLEASIAINATTASKMEAMIERLIERDSGRWKWVLGQAVVVVAAVGSAWMSMSSRVTVVEGRHEAMRDKVSEIDRMLDKIDSRIDSIADRLGLQAKPDTASGASSRWKDPPTDP